MYEDLARAFRFYRALGEASRDALDTRIRQFVETKRFVSDGEPLDERTKVFIAALACRLTIGLPDEELSRLALINVVDRIEGAVGLQEGTFSATVTFEREALARAFDDDDDGHNVVYHEIAHVLDAADGIADGIPPLLSDPLARDRWRDVLTRDVERLRAAAAMNIPTAVNWQGAESEIELFAVATEAFFERPQKLKNAHPELYALLVAFYRQMP